MSVSLVALGIFLTASECEADVFLELFTVTPTSSSWLLADSEEPIVFYMKSAYFSEVQSFIWEVVALGDFTVLFFFHAAWLCSFLPWKKLLLLATITSTRSPISLLIYLLQVSPDNSKGWLLLKTKYFYWLILITYSPVSTNSLFCFLLFFLVQLPGFLTFWCFY